MKLLAVTRCTPKHDPETKELIGWDKEQVFINPDTIVSMNFEKGLDRWILNLQKGSMIVEETPDTLIKNP